jgi:hypothetical protein
MPAILEPDAPIPAGRLRRFTGRLGHYVGNEGPPKPTLGGMMAKLPFEERPTPPISTMPQNPGDIAVGEGFEKMGLERRATTEAAKGGQILSNAEDMGEIVLSDNVPKMPPKPGNIVADRPGGATSEPLPQDRPAARSGPTPQQARIQAEMDAAAEQLTGREANALKNQRALVAGRASQTLNAPMAAEDLLSSVGQADAPAESAAGPTSRIRDKLAGVARNNPVTRAAEGVGGILGKVPGVARTGRILSRLTSSPVARFAGKYVYPAVEGLGAGMAFWHGREEDTDEIDPDTGEPVIDENTGVTQRVNKGIYEPTQDEMQYAARGKNNLLGAPLITKERTMGIPFTEDDKGEARTLPWAGGILGNAATDAALVGMSGPAAPFTALAIGGSKILRVAGAGGKAWAEASNAEDYKKASEAKYGTVEKATETRHKMEKETASKNAAKEREKFLIEMGSKYQVDFEGQ